jgi:dienelactone hydrolase
MSTELSSEIGRRDALKLALGSLVAGPALASAARAQVLDKDESRKLLYPAANLAGGGQLEVRIMVSAEHPDPDVRDVARRMKPFNPESWFTEWTRVAEKNEKVAQRFEDEVRKASAHEWYLRATEFYRNAVIYLPEADARLVPTYHKMSDNFDKAWSLAKPPFERVNIAYEGHMLPAHFFPARVAAGQRAPVVYNYAGADGILLRGDAGGGAGQFLARGMSFLDVDGPGHGGTLRLGKLYTPPDSERVVKAVIDYLVSRPDVDPSRIGIHGSSMGGYSAPRAATVEKRIAAVAVWSGAFSLRENIWDYYPPIHERLRWLMGAKDFTDASQKIGEFTLADRAKQIECPMLVGYSKDDRIMDPAGALRLYEEATNSKREMLDGVGHGEKKFEVRTYIADWFARQFKTL